MNFFVIQALVLSASSGTCNFSSGGTVGASLPESAHSVSVSHTGPVTSLSFSASPNAISAWAKSCALSLEPLHDGGGSIDERELPDGYAVFIVQEDDGKVCIELWSSKQRDEAALGRSGCRL